MGRFVRELRTANRLIDRQVGEVGRLRQAYEELGRTRVSPPSAPGEPAGDGGVSEINVNFRVDQSSVGVAVAPGATTPTGAGIAGARIGTSGGQGGSGAGASGSGSGVQQGLPNQQIDLDAIAAAVSGVPIPLRREWDPRGLGGLLDAATILITVSLSGAQAEYPLLVWCSGWLAYAVAEISSSSGGGGTGGYRSGRQRTSPLTYIDNGAGRNVNLDNGAGANVNLDNGAGANVQFGAVTSAVKDTGDRTVKAIEGLGKTITAALAGDGGASLRLQGGL